MKVRFVTGAYDDLNGTKYYGRINRGGHYVFSLSCLNNMGKPITCFTNKRTALKMAPYLALEDCENIELVNYNLEDYKHHKAIQDIRNKNEERYTNASWEQRCVEIMWGKFEWMSKVLEEMDDEDYLFWIDAGLSHPGVVPSSKYNPYPYHSMSPALKHEYAFRNERLFTPEFVDGIVEYTGEKLLNILCNRPQHSDPMPVDYTRKIVGSVIGGLFGGKKKVMQPYIASFEEAASYFLQKESLVKEEEIMTYLLNINFDSFKLFQFDTWYHIDWDSYDKDEISFSDFFKEVRNEK